PRFASLGRRSRLGGRLLAGLPLRGDALLELPLLLVALGLVLLAAIDAPLARGEGVDLDRPLELVGCVLVHGAAGRLHVYSQPLQAVDDLPARDPQIPSELEDPNVHHPVCLPRPARRPRRPRRARPRPAPPLPPSRPTRAPPRAARLPAPAARRPRPPGAP